MLGRKETTKEENVYKTRQLRKGNGKAKKRQVLRMQGEQIKWKR